MKKYFDHSSTALIDEEVLDYYSQALRDYPYNPAASYSEGKRVKQAIDKANREIAKMLDCKPTEIIYTSSGTESINTAINSVAWQTRQKNGQLITFSGEHAATRESFTFLENYSNRNLLEIKLTDAIPSLNSLEAHLQQEKVDLITFMLVSNITGAIYPHDEILKLLGKYSRQARVHMDGVQALGKIDLSFNELKADYLSLSLHKIGTPKGFGLLLAKENIPFQALILGGGQQSGRRSSTENPAQALASAFAIKKVLNNKNKNREHVKVLKQEFLTRLEASDLEYELLTPEKSVANIISLYIPGLRAQNIQTALDAEGYLVGIGSACASAKATASPQIEALDLLGEQAFHVLRVSLSSDNSLEDTTKLADKLVKIVDTYGVK